jgi:class 3 adenylate cyclase
MECPTCRTENPPHKKFCRGCGGKLVPVCPQCGSENLPGDKFCGECGQALAAPSETPPPKSPTEKRPAPSALPKELTEKILAQKGRIEGERRQVTVMFCDLEGSTALTEKLGDEKAFGLIDEIFGLLTQQVHKYEGTVQEFRGDGVMALFGAPIAMENAAQRAVSAALAIQQEVTKFSHRIQEEARGPAIRMRIGIHTGPVVLGTIGSDLRLEFQVIGDTVNLAARVESLAEPGTTYVTEETFKQTEGFFRFEKIGQKPVKGKETLITVYRVIAPSSLRTRFDVSAEQGLTPLVGRQRELEFLLDGFERAKAGKGQVFTIISEAGLGKSRLLYEFRKAIGNEEITFLEGRCISYGRGLAYHPIIAILRSFFNIQEGEEDLRVKGQVKKGLEILGVEVDTTLPFLLEFLSVQDSGLKPLQMSPEAKRKKMIEALKRIILKGAEIRPLVIALEDLH